VTDVACNAQEAVTRGLSIVGHGGMYLLGTGDFHPRIDPRFGLVDVPWTDGGRQGASVFGSDCAGFAITWAWKVKRHRPGYNHGNWSTVEDDINCNSLIEDANHKQELATEVDTPQPGDLLAYPTFNLRTQDGADHRFIGHVGLVSSAPATWDLKHRRYDLCSVVQCHGPNGFKPGVVATDGSIWLHHDVMWPKPEHRTHIIRMKERK